MLELMSMSFGSARRLYAQILLISVPLDMLALLLPHGSPVNATMFESTMVAALCWSLLTSYAVWLLSGGGSGGAKSGSGGLARWIGCTALFAAVLAGFPFLFFWTHRHWPLYLRLVSPILSLAYVALSFVLSLLPVIVYAGAGSVAEALRKSVRICGRWRNLLAMICLSGIGAAAIALIKLAMSWPGCVQADGLKLLMLLVRAIAVLPLICLAACLALGLDDKSGVGAGTSRMPSALVSSSIVVGCNLLSVPAYFIVYNTILQIYMATGAYEGFVTVGGLSLFPSALMHLVLLPISAGLVGSIVQRRSSAAWQSVVSGFVFGVLALCVSFGHRLCTRPHTIIFVLILCTVSAWCGGAIRRRMGGTTT